jgi:hypothetical protein
MTDKHHIDFTEIEEDERSSELYNDLSFLSGMGSAFNIGGNYYDFNYSESDEEADTKSLKRDWEMVGRTIYSSIVKLRIRIDGE